MKIGNQTSKTTSEIPPSHELTPNLVPTLLEHLPRISKADISGPSDNKFTIKSQTLTDQPLEDLTKAFTRASRDGAEEKTLILLYLPYIERAAKKDATKVNEALKTAGFHRRCGETAARLIEDIPQLNPDTRAERSGIKAEVDRVEKRIDEEYPLHKAVRDGDVARVRTLLSQGMDVNQPDPTNITPLFLAAEAGNLQIVSLLVRCGTDIHATDNLSRTALSWAARNGHADVVNTLLTSGAAIDGTDNGGQSALLLAAAHKQYSAVLTLLDRGANVNLTDRKGQTALRIAAGLNQEFIVELLLDHGADLSIASLDGKTPLSAALQMKAKRAYEVLVAAGCDREIRDRLGSSVKACGKRDS